MSAVDRMADGYEPDFDIDSAVGKQGELYVAAICDSMREGTGRVEVKTDEKAIKTGNVFVEYRCMKFGKYEPSGIATTQAELWAIVLGSDTVLIVPTWRLKTAARRLLKDAPRFFGKECVRGSHPTKGVIIPLKSLLTELFKEAS